MARKKKSNLMFRVRIFDRYGRIVSKKSFRYIDTVNAYIKWFNSGRCQNERYYRLEMW